MQDVLTIKITKELLDQFELAQKCLEAEFAAKTACFEAGKQTAYGNSEIYKKEWCKQYEKTIEGKPVYVVPLSINRKKVMTPEGIRPRELEDGAARVTSQRLIEAWDDSSVWSPCRKANFSFASIHLTVRPTTTIPTKEYDRLKAIEARMFYEGFYPHE